MGRPRIACDPPIGLTTVNEGSNVTFYVWVTDIEEAESYQVSIWHDGNESGSWGDFELQHVGSFHHTQRFKGCFTTPPIGQVHFTLKFRLRGGEWQWLNDLEARPDGEILIQTQHISTELRDFLEDWDIEWQVQHTRSGTTHTSWILTANVDGSSGSQSAWTQLSLGLPKRVLKWFAIVRHSRPWLGPRHGDTFFNPDKEALMVSFLREDGLHFVMLAMNGVPHLTTTIRGNEAGGINVAIRNDGSDRRKSSVIVCAAKTVAEAISTVTGVAQGLLQDGQDATVHQNGDTRSDLERWWYDAFTYCTWNGLGQQLSEKKILDALDELQAHKLDFSTLVIDDNWQSLDFKGSSNFDYKWSEFEANKHGFPNGLGHTIRKIRAAYPKIKHIAVWHGMFGYWGGMDPEGNVVKSYKSREAMKQTGETYLTDGPLTTVQGQEIGRMYDAFYAFLAASGIDSVKADNQFMPDYLADGPDRQDTIYTYQEAWLSAVEKHFQHRGMASMSQTPQILFHSYLKPSHRPPYLVRNSDDFFPHEPASHTWHIFCNAQNALLTQHFNMLPDWDMFQTAGQCATMHGVARCLSGGPLYITDVPGEHDFELIEDMTAKAIDGSSVVLRPESIATTMEAYVRPHSDRFLRLGTTHQQILILGLVNVGEKFVDELVKLTSFPRVEPERSYIVRSHFGGNTTGPMNIHDKMPVVQVSLEPQGVEVLSAAPVYESGGITFAALGLLHKISGAAAIRSFGLRRSESGDDTVLTVALKALGVFGLWLDDAHSYVDAKKIHTQLTIGRHDLPVSMHQEAKDLLQFDVLLAARSLPSEEPYADHTATLVVRICELESRVSGRL